MKRYHRRRPIGITYLLRVRVVRRLPLNENLFIALAASSLGSDELGRNVQRRFAVRTYKL